MEYRELIILVGMLFIITSFLLSFDQKKKKKKKWMGWDVDVAEEENEEDVVVEDTMIRVQA
jgi:hypothetical protein